MPNYRCITLKKQDFSTYSMLNRYYIKTNSYQGCLSDNEEDQGFFKPNVMEWLQLGCSFLIDCFILYPGSYL